jgi:hypothetical protein
MLRNLLRIRGSVGRPMTELTIGHSPGAGARLLYVTASTSHAAIAVALDVDEAEHLAELVGAWAADQRERLGGLDRLFHAEQTPA